MLFAILAVMPADIADIHAAKVELQLVRDNLANSTLALAHASHANEHVRIDLVGLQSDIMTDSQAAQLRTDKIDAALDESLKAEGNSTLIALALEGIVRDSAKHYESAIGVEEEDEHDEPIATVSIADYQSARALAAKASELFEELKPLAPADAEHDLTDLEFGLQQLEIAIGQPATMHRIEDIVHGHILNSLYEAFNIQATPEFSVPMIAAVAVALAVTGIRIVKRR